jgi:hypothetical protein
MLLSSMKVTPQSKTSQLTFGLSLRTEEEPNKSGSKKDLLFRGTLIEQDKPDLSASFYAE